MSTSEVTNNDDPTPGPDDSGPNDSGTGDSGDGAASTTPGSRFAALIGDDYRRVKILAAATGLIGFLLAVLVPILPVNQETSKLSWPQNGEVGNVTAPLVAFVPISVDLSVPCSLARDLPEQGGVLLSTIPAQGSAARARGLFIEADSSTLKATLRNVPILSTDRATAENDPDCAVVLRGDGERVTAAIEGVSGDGNLSWQADDPDMRPQILGVFTDLANSAPADGLALDAVIDTRFVTSPTPLKLAAIVIGLLLALLSLITLGVLDQRDGRAHKRFLPAGWFTIRGPDVVVFAVLAFWWLAGANTSDDGYVLTVGRITGDAGYAANYYRYFGVPQDPFGWHNYAFAWMSEISVAVPWLRLPSLLLGLLGWWLISREVIPRLGRAVRTSQAAVWSGALVFLAIWLPYNNGTRPEPAEAVGALLTWCCVERAIATRRLLPFAVAVIVAAFTLALAPGGLMAVAALIAGLRPVVKTIVARRKRDGVLPLVGPILAAGTVVLFPIFYGQTFAALLEGNKVASEVGPTNEWWQEPVRYYYLILNTGDGTLARRFGILIMIMCLVIAIFRLLSRNHPSGVARAPLWRLIAVMLGTMFFISFTPTKWTHHLGVYAGIGAAIAAATAAMMGPALLRSRRNRTFFATGVLVVTAISFAGTNMWWYVGSYGIPWWDRTPAVAGVKLSWLILALALVTAAVGLWYYLRDDYVDDDTRTGRNRTGLARFAFSPLPVISGLVIVFILASFAKGAWVQRDSWSWAKSNVRALTGNSCGLADGILVEPDPQANILIPASIGGAPAPAPDQAIAQENTGFTPTGVSSSAVIDPVDKKSSSSDDDATEPAAEPGQAATNDGTSDSGDGEMGDGDLGDGETSDAEATDDDATPAPEDRGSVRLPFGLNAQTPVLGSYGTDGSASVTTAWYDLGFAAGDAPEESPLVVIAAAGSIHAIDGVAAVNAGQSLVLEYGRVESDGSVTPVGRKVPLDAAPSTDWRDLRFPLDEAPPRATVVRIVATDTSPSDTQWLAFTPPRVPKLTGLDDLVGRTDPVFIDWMAGFVFPCQRPMAISNGVLELPQWRIMPDTQGITANSQTWMAGKFGGPLGITEGLLRQTIVPSYFRNNWARDWGYLGRFTPIVPDAVPADLELGTSRESGLTNPAPMRYLGY